MIIKTGLLLLSFALSITTAAAQTRPWPIVNGRQPQPTAQQIESREGYSARGRDVWVQSELDRLYDQITRAATPQRH